MPDPGACEATQTHRRVAEERFVLPNEMLMLQGWPVKGSPVDLDQFSDHTKCSFAGNMFMGSVCMSVIASVFAAILWAPLPSEEDRCDDAEAQDAVDAALQLCM